LTSRGRLFGGTLLGAALSACGAAQTAVPAPVAPEREAVRAPELPEEVTPFHSVRLELTVPLPDRERWRTVEAPRGDLELTHIPTRSRLTVALFADPELVSRQKCEERARDRKLVPDGALTTVLPTWYLFPFAIVAVLGLVGGGGVGFLLIQYMKKRFYGTRIVLTASTLLEFCSSLNNREGLPIRSV